MESYRDLAILATNKKSALDPAFMRRLRFIVTFAFPGVAERKLMWQKVFPPQTPIDALDHDRRRYSQHCVERHFHGSAGQHSGEDADRVGSGTPGAGGGFARPADDGLGESQFLIAPVVELLTARAAQ